MRESNYIICGLCFSKVYIISDSLVIECSKCKSVYYVPKTEFTCSFCFSPLTILNSEHLICSNIKCPEYSIINDSISYKKTNLSLFYIAMSYRISQLNNTYNTNFIEFYNRLHNNLSCL